MRRLLLLLLLIAAAFIALNKQRLYLRDPLARVTRSGASVRGARAYINYSNDVLLEDSSGDRHRVYLVQNWNGLPAAPSILRCLDLTACLADADHASATPLPNAKVAAMTNTRVAFADEDGFPITVVLR